MVVRVQLKPKSALVLSFMTVRAKRWLFVKLQPPKVGCILWTELLARSGGFDELIDFKACWN